jgi:hypothetical protein
VRRPVPWFSRVAFTAAAVALLVVVLWLAVGDPSTSRARPATPEPSPATAAKATVAPVEVTRTSGPVPKLIWGPVTFPNGRSAFPTYHRLGVDVFQIDLNWAETATSRPADPDNPSDPAYQWPAELTQAIAQAARYHIKISLLVQGAPAWANGGRASDWAPTRASDYGNFLTAAARRYPSVHLWMIWGEPNRAGNFYPMPANSKVGPERYALILNAGYHALKGVSTANIVIGGDTWSFGTVEPADFVKWMRLPDGQPPPLDYYGHNPFSRRFPDLSETPYYPGGRDINDIDTLDAQLDRVYQRPVKLWLSEFTVSSNHGNRAFSFAVSRQAQAKWLTAAFRLADSVNYVAGMGWFNLVDQAPLPGNQALTTGLLTYRLTPKPAYYAYQRAP